MFRQAPTNALAPPRRSTRERRDSFGERSRARREWRCGPPFAADDTRLQFEIEWQKWIRRCCGEDQRSSMAFVS
jgi:hypothetical protein